MTARPLRALMLGGLVLPFAFATAGLAQDQPPAPPADAPAGGHHHGWGDPAQRAQMMAKHLEREAARLRDALQLRPDQESALHAFLESMKPPADALEHMKKDREEDARLTTPQRLDQMMAHMDERRAHAVAHAEAVKRFYAQLSPSQQKAFDALGPMMHGPHGMGEHRGMGPHGPEDGPPPGGPMDGPPPAA
ncbi:Spy/CpxP family protein refolding chaperone [Caulobacter sp. KR2-114]|uniref:Spy/CpxP family protein refolding chaperone n=1 Tax=Caulobacter sp. KR2-114 TaxID=3400912 RepID=UPI003C11AADF